MGVSARIRRANRQDAEVVAALAADLAQSFAFSRPDFDRTFPDLLARADACLLIAEDAGISVGYLLGFRHLTFYANGPVGWVEELLVRDGQRGRGVGRALMNAFERWAADGECALVALATRRAAAFYRALGYQDSAAYLRKVLPGQSGAASSG